MARTPRLRRCAWRLPRHGRIRRERLHHLPWLASTRSPVRRPAARRLSRRGAARIIRLRPLVGGGGGSGGKAGRGGSHTSARPPGGAEDPRILAGGPWSASTLGCTPRAASRWRRYTRRRRARARRRPCGRTIRAERTAEDSTGVAGLRLTVGWSSGWASSPVRRGGCRSWWCRGGVGDARVPRAAARCRRRRRASSSQARRRADLLDAAESAPPTRSTSSAAAAAVGAPAARGSMMQDHARAARVRRRRRPRNLPRRWRQARLPRQPRRAPLRSRRGDPSAPATAGPWRSWAGSPRARRRTPPARRLPRRRPAVTAQTRPALRPARRSAWLRRAGCRFRRWRGGKSRSHTRSAAQTRALPAQARAQRTPSPCRARPTRREVVMLPQPARMAVLVPPPPLLLHLLLMRRRRQRRRARLDGPSVSLHIQVAPYPAPSLQARPAAICRQS